MGSACCKANKNDVVQPNMLPKKPLPKILNPQFQEQDQQLLQREEEKQNEAQILKIGKYFFDNEQFQITQNSIETYKKDIQQCSSKFLSNKFEKKIKNNFSSNFNAIKEEQMKQKIRTQYIWEQHCESNYKKYKQDQQAEQNFLNLILGMESKNAQR
ncbi:hypothetical protein PPERSA_01020 [Pseudocohnilembus persalinus]|uniref:Uncharacterized protein n=1 Tax=Pseudocohnilembus persalinus TaxID=266149 RepID=A0A0V0QUW5_PSEPJ|nr:hypothetical protein PPERSA_01020 [Pseudocohnilembus persalinus]|eukprot:KRX05942.1 hypothetical protein PPERSA_01020 [Pseudocohnilembus persalinus]